MGFFTCRRQGAAAREERVERTRIGLFLALEILRLQQPSLIVADQQMQAITQGFC